MSKRSQKMWVGVDCVGGALLGLLTGKARMKLPKDAEIVHVRCGEMFNIAEFLVRSEEYPELETGMRIPIEVGDSCEKIVSISPQHAQSLSELVRCFKKMIEEGYKSLRLCDYPVFLRGGLGTGQAKELTTRCCDELVQILEEGE